MQLKTMIKQERRGRRGGTQVAESDPREAVDRIDEAINARRPVPDKERNKHLISVASISKKQTTVDQSLRPATEAHTSGKELFETITCHFFKKS
jgi:hypothetical protein